MIGPDDVRRPDGEAQDDSGSRDPKTALTPADGPRRRVPPIDKTQARTNAFFDRLHDELWEMSNRLDLGNPHWLMALSSFESGWYDPEKSEGPQFNNPFGLTHGGGPKLKFRSLRDAIRYWEIFGALGCEAAKPRINSSPPSSTRL